LSAIFVFALERESKVEMKIWQIDLKNFRGFKDRKIKWSWDEKLIVFAGINGSGKSSLLDAVAILLSRYISFARNTSAGRRLISPLDVRQGERAAFIALSFLHEDFNGLFATKGEKPELSPEQGVFYSPGYFDKLRIADSVPILASYPASRIVQEPALRASISRSTKLPTPLDAYVNALGDKRTDFGSFFTWFRNMEDYENEQKRDDPNHKSPQLETVRRAIPSLLEGYDNLRVRRRPLHLTLTKNGVEFDIRQLSDGEKCLIAMVGDIAHRLALANPKSENPLEGEGIVLIDEIELHLHPKWQREVVPRLQATFPNCQFILTTHSPQVIASVRPENLFLLGEDGKIEQASSSYGRDSNGILEEVMGVDERPTEIKEQLGMIFDAIDAEQLEEAKKQIRDLSNIIGDSEPELAHAEMRIRLKESLKREASKVAAH
jgi:predicted ATP-binding protein involved in virulence